LRGPRGHAFLQSAKGQTLKKVNLVAKTMMMQGLGLGLGLGAGVGGGGRGATPIAGSARDELLRNVGKYVPSAVIPFINHHEEKVRTEWPGPPM